MNTESAVGAQQFSPARKRWLRSAMNTESAVGAAHSLAPGASEAEDPALNGRRYGKSKSYPRLAGLCYNRAAVNSAANPEDSQPAKACDSVEAASQAGQVPELLDKQRGNEDPSRYCPVCSQRLESRRCKLICSVCGYYMSCADYY